MFNRLDRNNSNGETQISASFLKAKIENLGGLDTNLVTQSIWVIAAAFLSYWVYEKKWWSDITSDPSNSLSESNQTQQKQEVPCLELLPSLVEQCIEKVKEKARVHVHQEYNNAAANAAIKHYRNCNNNAFLRAKSSEKADVKPLLVEQELQKEYSICERQSEDIIANSKRNVNLPYIIEAEACKAEAKERWVNIYWGTIWRLKIILWWFSEKDLHSCNDWIL